MKLNPSSELVDHMAVSPDQLDAKFGYGYVHAAEAATIAHEPNLGMDDVSKCLPGWVKTICIAFEKGEGVTLSHDAVSRLAHTLIAARRRQHRLASALEVRDDGEVVRKDRWEWAVRRIVALLWGNRKAFECDEVVEAVRDLIPLADGDDEAIIVSAQRLLTGVSNE